MINGWRTVISFLYLYPKTFCATVVVVVVCFYCSDMRLYNTFIINQLKFQMCRFHPAQRAYMSLLSLNFLKYNWSYLVTRIKKLLMLLIIPTKGVMYGNIYVLRCIVFKRYFATFLVWCSSKKDNFCRSSNCIKSCYVIIFINMSRLMSM